MIRLQLVLLPRRSLRRPLPPRDDHRERRRDGPRRRLRRHARRSSDRTVKHRRAQGALVLAQRAIDLARKVGAK